jgi:hypothetical protein
MNLAAHTANGHSCKLQALFGVPLQFYGRISIPATALYTFYLTSDDGSRLLIDGQLVCDNAGLHPPLQVVSNHSLTAGWHSIK